MGYYDTVDIETDNNYQRECIMYDPSIPVGYESYYRDEPVYVVIYEGYTRWNGESCEERKSVDVDEYSRAKAILGEKQ